RFGQSQGEVVHTLERSLSTRPELGFANRQHPLEKSDALSSSALCEKAYTQPDDGIDRVGMIFTKELCTYCSRGLILSYGGLAVREQPVRMPQGHAKPSLCERLVLEAFFDARHSGVDGRPERYFRTKPAVAALGTSRGEDLVLNEIENGLGLGLFG